MRAIYRDYNRLGDKLWERFNQKDKLEHFWYYNGIANRLTFLKETEAYKDIRKRNCVSVQRYKREKQGCYFI